MGSKGYPNLENYPSGRVYIGVLLTELSSGAPGFEPSASIALGGLLQLVSHYVKKRKQRRYLEDTVPLTPEKLYPAEAMLKATESDTKFEDIGHHVLQLDVNLWPVECTSVESYHDLNNW